MNREETAEVLAIIKAGIPNAYLKLTDADAAAMVMLWTEMFGSAPKDLVMAAAKTYVWNDKTGKFPAPGALREEMGAIRDAIDFCARGFTLWEHMGDGADRFPPAVQTYIEREYREESRRVYGREFVGQIERITGGMQLEAGSA